MSNLDTDHIKQYMNGAHKVDIRCTKFWHETRPKMKWEGEKGSPERDMVQEIGADGQPVTEDIEMVEYVVHCGGVPNTVVAEVRNLLAVNHRNADSSDPIAMGTRARAIMVDQQRAQFYSGKQEATPEGQMSLEKWGQLTPNAVASLKFARIYSVQQLAEASESVIQRIPSGLQPTLLRQQAINFLRQTAAAALPDALVEERAARVRLESQVDDLKAMLDKMLNAGLATSGASGEDEAPKRRGRAPMPRDANGEIIRDQEAA
jgi:hypothetical protein